MKTTSVTFPVDTIRVSHIVGASRGDVPIYGDVVVSKKFSITMTPVIKTGESTRFPKEGPILQSYKSPDTFQYFELVLSYAGWRRWFRRERPLEIMLDRHCAVELWTKNEDEASPWIHWLFTSTSWVRRRGRWEGQSHSDGFNVRPEDLPDSAPVSDGAFWKTPDAPPA